MVHPMFAGDTAPSAVRERGIIFSGPMVRAILEGKKTVTRRIIRQLACKGEGGWSRPQLLRMDATRGFAVFGDSIPDDPVPLRVRCIYGAEGERLWVRETWAPMCRVADPWCHCEDADMERNHYTEYRADTGTVHPGDWPEDEGGEFVPRWRPSIHMPRERCRLRLTTIELRAERLQGIDDADALAEGVELYDARRQHHRFLGRDCFTSPREAFQWGWDQINQKRASWEENPWVWRLAFEEFARAAA